MKIYSFVTLIFCCVLCANGLAWAAKDVNSRSRRATQRTDDQGNERSPSSALPVVRPTVTATPGLDVSTDHRGNPPRPSDVTKSVNGGKGEGSQEGNITLNATNGTSGDATDPENSNKNKPIYWPWGQQLNDKTNESFSVQNLTDSSEGLGGSRSESGDIQNSGQGRPQNVPWPWGPGVQNGSVPWGNGSVSPSPGSNSSPGTATDTSGSKAKDTSGSKATDTDSSQHVHHVLVPELDDARLADASVVVARAEGMYFIQRLFQRYNGNQDNRGRLSVSDLAALLENILFRSAIEKTDATHVHNDSSAEVPLYRPQEDPSGAHQGLHEEHSHVSAPSFIFFRICFQNDIGSGTSLIYCIVIIVFVVVAPSFN